MLTNHLGNNRATFDVTNGKTGEYDFYPFGLNIQGSVVGNPKNLYTYNKKELQQELGQYDYGARFYDPVIARWTSVDPLAEKSQRWSPYNYVMCNPILLIDPDGMEGPYMMSDADAIKFLGSGIAIFGDSEEEKVTAKTAVRYSTYARIDANEYGDYRGDLDGFAKMTAKDLEDDNIQTQGIKCTDDSGF
jgi:RHS repeat-associated protein